jgi:hypothetical protein
VPQTNPAVSRHATPQIAESQSDPTAVSLEEGFVRPAAAVSAASNSGQIEEKAEELSNRSMS